MTQEELLLYEIEKLMGRITTHELMTLGIMQYQARLKGLREKLARKGITLTDGEPVLNQKRCFMYRIIKPINRDTQIDLFQVNQYSPGLYQITPNLRN